MLTVGLFTTSVIVWCLISHTSEERFQIEVVTPVKSNVISGTFPKASQQDQACDWLPFPVKVKSSFWLCCSLTQLECVRWFSERQMHWRCQQADWSLYKMRKGISPTDLELQPPHWLPSLVSFGIKHSWKAHRGYRKMAADDRRDVKSLLENSKFIVGFFA